MAKYKFIYTVNEGDYAMEVFTGVHILAEARDEAMNAARRLDGIISSSCQFSASFELFPLPHVVVQCKTFRGEFPDGKDESCVKSFKISCPQGAHKHIMGYPVFTKADFKIVSETEFLESVKDSYTNYFTRKNRTYITFEPISYGIEEME